MYLFDTNILSEAMKAAPDPAVAAWLSACPLSAMFTTAITQSEILTGVRLLPEGRRRALLEQAAAALFAETFADRVLPFDACSAQATADIRVACQAAGTPVSSSEDVMIAGIARQHGATVVTRDRGFAAYGVPLVNPWEG
jgi:predicted nucleic acid-binding protein